ncbi:nucleolar protein 12 [Anthonomus grandis grandis]|uniref:nucleolar protein 12 n=1 Tax=Anthonomus grandis grandis TaxID=2921223 RepID=UPI00216660C3|nr:nucleolar protein 12 [Anthonomus grandis grandis]
MGHMALTDVKKGKRKPKNRSNKIHLVFDEVKRREFLTGFRKRKLIRKKQAQEKLAQELKEERKRLKAEAKESYKKLVVSHRDIPELENLLSEEYEEGDVTVKVVELSANNIAKQNNWIGANQLKCENETREESSNDDEEEEQEVPGMELKAKPLKAKPKVPKETFSSERDVKKKLKKEATKKVQKSKIFQKKNKLERQKQKKQSMQAKRLKEKDGAKCRFGKKKGKKGPREKH